MNPPHEMDPDWWNRLQSIFFAALESTPEERAALLDRECAGNPEMRAEVDAVLAGHRRAGGPTVVSTSDEWPETLAEAESLAGQRIGVYQLIEKIGEGGMGEVYRAERVDDSYRQQVAIKFVRSSLPANEMAGRFRVERQVLARLQHANVAALLDGGVTSGGIPYLVMQYVDGLPITEYADSRGLTVADRLRLFTTVCRAVQFAHSNLIVHRDLKPSNILVSGGGEVRLLDFGIAKLLDPQGMGITAPLTEELLLLTPEHAAPEQLTGDPITTATDVYALGVLLFELLTGTRPFRAAIGIGWHRAVCEMEPPRPSTALTTLANEADGDAARVAARRGTRPIALRQELRGDLDHIVLKALRKEPSQRYASAEQFAEDVERCLERRPVLARRDTFAYRTRKFLRRNRWGVAAAAVVLVTLTGATLVTAGQSKARAAALAEARVERDRASDLAGFMLSVFQANDPATSRGEDVTARELLDRAVQRADTELAGQPSLQSQMKLAMGRAYGALGYFDVALSLLEDAYEVRSADPAASPVEIAEALDQLGRGLAAAGRHQEAIPRMREALRTREQVHGSRDTLVASTLTALGRMTIEVGRYEDARTMLEQAVEIYREQPSIDGRSLSNALRFLWLSLYWTGETELELPVAREALTIAQSSLLPDDPHLLNVMQDYALALESGGQIDSAVSVTRAVMDGQIRVLGPDHVSMSYAYHNLGRVLRQLGDLPGAVEAYRRGLEIRERALGPEHPVTGYLLHSLAIALIDVGEIAAAVQMEERAVRIFEGDFGAEHGSTRDSRELLAQLYALQGRPDAAISTLERLVDTGWTNAPVLGNAVFADVREMPRFQRLLARLRGSEGSN